MNYCVNPTCTPEELVDIIVAPNGGYYTLPTDPYNEVYPGIYIGDAPTALCTGLLQRMGITHVVNAAQGADRDFGYVNTTEGFYGSSGIKFLGIPAMDIRAFKLEPYFEEAADFIHEARTSGGKVLVHCRQGISRSSTIVLAYLMIKKSMTVQEATRKVRENRDIIPNPGFLQQLCDLNEKLERDRRLANRRR